MKLDAETVLNKVKNINPKLILDVGFKTKISSIELSAKYPEAKILSYQYDNHNFLLDSTALAYHDKIRFAAFNPDSFHLDDLIYGIVDKDSVIDFINIDIYGREKNILQASGIWPKNTRYIKVKLGNYNYLEAKNDLKVLGFQAYAIYENKDIYVVGEPLETFSRYTTSLQSLRY